MLFENPYPYCYIPAVPREQHVGWAWKRPCHADDVSWMDCGRKPGYYFISLLTKIHAISYWVPCRAALWQRDFVKDSASVSVLSCLPHVHHTLSQSIPTSRWVHQTARRAPFMWDMTPPSTIRSIRTSVPKWWRWLMLGDKPSPFPWNHLPRTLQAQEVAEQTSLVHWVHHVADDHDIH